MREAFLELPKHGSLNVHPSLLPRWRGATPIPAAILAGDELTGTSIQRMVLKLDAGDVVVQERLAIEPDETTGELMARLAELSGDALVTAIDRIADGTAVFTPQAVDGITLCKKLKKTDGDLDWSRPAHELERRVRAMHPWPGGATTLPDEEPLRVWRVRVVEGSGTPGEVLEGSKRLVVAAGEGALELLEIQAAGKKAMDAKSFLLGRTLERGTRLGSASQLDSKAEA